MSPRKVITNDISINAAETKLGFKYPQMIREKLKEKNGFEWGGYRFFPVLDEEDKEHTFDDVVRENTNPVAGWNTYIPEGYVCIASLDEEGLLVSKNGDDKYYFYMIGDEDINEVVENSEALTKILEELENLE